MTERQLVTIRTINNLEPITGADNIVCATIDGWKVVVKKGEFNIGDSCVFFEIDSFLPASDARYDFLAKTKRTWRGKEGYRLKTIKLKGQLSQGLALPTHMFPEGIPAVEKWEEDIHPSLMGQVKGTFPSFIPKTDEERIQNLYNKIDINAEYEVTLKMDGTSLTVFRFNDELGVCSRNQQLKINEENKDNLYVKQVPIFANIPEGYAVQAEIIGPNIQSNRIGLDQIKVTVFNIFDIKAGKYLPADLRINMCNLYGWSHCPVIYVGVCPELSSLDTALKHATSFKYDNGLPAEGLVYKRLDGSMSFKIINNEFLIKYGL